MSGASRIRDALDDGYVRITDDVIDYVLRYGGRCRDCADADGVCLQSGLPCDVDDATRAIHHVLRAINFGIANGFLNDPP